MIWVDGFPDFRCFFDTFGASSWVIPTICIQHPACFFFFPVVKALTFCFFLHLLEVFVSSDFLSWFKELKHLREHSMVTTIVPPYWKPSNLSSFFHKSSSTPKNLQPPNNSKKSSSNFHVKFSLPYFSTLLKAPISFFGGKIQPLNGTERQALHYAAYHGHLSCVTELLKSNPRKVPREKPRSFRRFFVTFFESFCHPREAFFFLDDWYHWYLLIEFEYGSLLFLTDGFWKLQTGLLMFFFGYVFCNSFWFLLSAPSYSFNKKWPGWC